MKNSIFDFTNDLEVVDITTSSNAQTVSNTNGGTFKARVQIETDAPPQLRFDAIVREVVRRLEIHAAAIGDADSVEIVIHS